MALRNEASAMATLAVLRHRTLADREDLLGRLMLAPAMAYVLLLVGAPLVLAVLLSFSSATAGNLSFSWIGLRNFATIVADPQFHSALSNTVVFTLVSQALVIVLATAAAFVLDAAFVGRRLVRFLILLPWAAPVSLAAMDWTLKVAGFLHGWFYWFGDPGLAKIAIVTVHVWRTFPFATVVVLAGMASIPRDISEAAVIDGAGFWRKLFQVDLPLLLPIVTVAVLFGVVFTSTDLGIVYLLTRGGPYNSTHVLASLAFQRGILGADLGQGAAIALFLLPVLIVVAVAMLRVARRTEVGT